MTDVITKAFCNGDEIAMGRRTASRDKALSLTTLTQKTIE